MTDGESPRRRDVLRAGTAAGLAALGWSANAASTQETTTGGEGGQQSEYAFSYSLQQGDRFQVLSRLRTPEGDPATETVPASCDPNGGQQYPVFIVRAYRQNIRLGYEGVLVPEGAVETAAETTGTTATEEEETTPAAEEPTVTDGETTTTAGETTTTAETETATTETETEAALQDETTTDAENETDAAAETETTVGTEATTAETETGEEAATTEGEVDATTAATETETETETTTTATAEPATEQAAGLPPIRVGNWYRVREMSKCDSVSRLSLEPAEPRETAAPNS